MNYNGMFPRKPAKPLELADALGGALVNKVPKPVPWGVFITCGIRVLDQGKPIVLMLEPQPIDDVDEAVGVFLLLCGMMSPKPGPLDWATVPESVRRHFREVDTTSTARPN